MLHHIEPCGIWLPKCKRQKFTSFVCSATHVVPLQPPCLAHFPLVILYMRTLFPIYGSTYNSLKVPCDFILLCLCILFFLYVEFSLSSLLSIYLRNLVSSLNQGIIWHYLLWRSYFISSEDLIWNPKVNVIIYFSVLL